MEVLNHQEKPKAVALEWMDLRSLTQYAAVSERTIREWIHRVEDPLPASQIEKKIFVRRSVFDRWLEAHAFRPVESLDINGIVNQVVADLRIVN